MYIVLVTPPSVLVNLSHLITPIPESMVSLPVSRSALLLRLRSSDGEPYYPVISLYIAMLVMPEDDPISVPDVS